MKKQPPKTQEPVTPKINFLVVLLVASLFIVLSNHYSKAKSLEASRVRVTPTVIPTATAIPSKITPTFKPSPITYPSLAPIPSPSPKPSPSPVTFSPLPSYTPCIVGSRTYNYLTDQQCQSYKDDQKKYDELLLKQEQTKLEQAQLSLEQEKLRQEAYDSCLLYATQRAHVICGSLGTCEATGYGGFDTILGTEKAKCHY